MTLAALTKGSITGLIEAVEEGGVILPASAFG